MTPIEPILTETHHERALRLGDAVPRFLQGVFPFAGRGLFDLALLDSLLEYAVPPGCRAQVVYFRGGNASDVLVNLVLTVNGVPLRYFPAGAGADFHVPLAISETHREGAVLSVSIAAPHGALGTVIVDVGIVEHHGATSGAAR